MLPDVKRQELLMAGADHLGRLVTHVTNRRSWKTRSMQVARTAEVVAADMMDVPLVTLTLLVLGVEQQIPPTCHPA